MSENYGNDYYGWLTSTAQAVLEGRDFDRAQVAEELQDMGKSEKRGIVSHLRVILLHLLKIRYQPDMHSHSRSWDASMRNSRHALLEEFEDSPSLAAQADALMLRAYPTARSNAEAETGLPLDTFPKACPFSVEDVIGGE